MSKVRSTPSVRRRKPKKPAKPRPDFPLFPHATGRWAKKIRGRMHYFGKWDDPDGALKKYDAEKEALHSGRVPRPETGQTTVKQACNSFLNFKKARLEAGELSPRTFKDYEDAAALVVDEFKKGRLVADLGPDDFAALRNVMSRRWGPVRVRDFIQRIRCIFKHAVDAGLIERPVRFGPGFARPSRKTLRLERARKGLRMFEAEELRRMLAAAAMPLRAMILLGVNCGYGNADCGTLPVAALDLGRGWANYYRPKTGIERRCPLWLETVEALKEALAMRPEPKDPAHAGRVFITARGQSWHRAIAARPISQEMRKLLDSVGINGHRNFYALRHTFETIGGESKDQVAVDAIMGHARDDMASLYRERISDERLKAVTDHIHAWLFPGEKAPRTRGRNRD
jgi:integrase